MKLLAWASKLDSAGKLTGIVMCLAHYLIHAPVNSERYHAVTSSDAEVRSFHGATIIGVEVVFSVENCPKFIESHTLRTDDVHCQESVGTGPVVLKVVEFYKRVPP